MFELSDILAQFFILCKSQRSNFKTLLQEGLQVETGTTYARLPEIIMPG